VTEIVEVKFWKSCTSAGLAPRSAESIKASAVEFAKDMPRPFVLNPLSVPHPLQVLSPFQESLFRPWHQVFTSLSSCFRSEEANASLSFELKVNISPA
jgi:hypothetical protein